MQIRVREPRIALANPPVAIAELRRWLDRTENPGPVAGSVLPFGIPEIDAHLPNGGLSLGHLHEVIESGPASEYASIAALFIGGILARLPGPVLWCLRGRDLFAPALARIGLHHDRVIYCETWNDRTVLPAMEEGLRCAGLAGVVGELTSLPLTASRRLQLCAGQSGVTGLVLRRWRNSTEKKLACVPNAAATRWRITPSPSPASGFDVLQRQQWLVELLRLRGGEPHSWVLEACNAKGYLAVPAALANGSMAAEESKRTATG